MQVYRWPTVTQAGNQFTETHCRKPVDRLDKAQRSRLVCSGEVALVPAHLVVQNLVILGEGEHVHGEAFEIRRVPTV